MEHLPSHIISTSKKDIKEINKQMSSEINNQVVSVQQLVIPTGTGIANNTSPSIPPIAGSLAYDATTPGIPYTGNGTLWQGASGVNDNPTFNSITLQTFGGTPTPLNYYEEGLISITWTGAMSATENMKFTRIGNIVTLKCDNLVSASTASVPTVANNALPTRLQPTYTMVFAIGVWNINVRPVTPGSISIGPGLNGQPAGQLLLCADMAAGSFTSGNIGHAPFSVSYSIG